MFCTATSGTFDVSFQGTQTTLSASMTQAEVRCFLSPPQAHFNDFLKAATALSANPQLGTTQVSPDFLVVIAPYVPFSL